MNHIIGIRYIGKKERKEDTLLGTGAVWLPGQVHNFAEALARQLLQHTDIYEEAPVAIDGDTFMGKSANGKATEAPAIPYVNLTGMDVDQLALFARREFNRTIDTERDVELVRAEVHRLMTTSNMDEIANEIEAGKGLNGGIPYAIRVSEPELEALMSGQLVVRLVPAEVADEAPAPELSDEERAALAQAEVENDGKQEPTLDELLASLTTKDELLAFAVQEGVDGLNGRHSVETMRTTISEAIKARTAGEPGKADA